MKIAPITLINKIDKCPKKVGHVVILYRSVKYTLTPSGILVLLGLLTWNFHYTIGIDHLRSYAKFQFGQLRDGYFIRPVSILPKIYAYWFYIILHSSSTHHKLVTVVRFYLRSWFFQRCWQFVELISWSNWVIIVFLIKFTHRHTEWKEVATSSAFELKPTIKIIWDNPRCSCTSLKEYQWWN